MDITFQFIVIAIWVLTYVHLLYSVFSGGQSRFEVVFSKYTPSPTATQKKLGLGNALSIAGACYLTKGLLAIVVIALQGLGGFNFRAALAWGMTMYAVSLHLLLPEGPTLTTWIYLAAALGLVVEWFLFGAAIY